MNSKPFLIASDIHLGAVPEATEKAFRRFLHHAGQEAAGLLINGDLFDFWFEYRTVVPRRYFRVLGVLADIVETGVPVWFVGGNHDAWVGSFLRDEVGITLLDGPVVLELGGRRTLVAHGDGVGSGDLGYKLLRSIIRHPLAIGGFRALHPDWGAWLAERASRTESRTESGSPGEASKHRANHIRQWASQQLAETPELDLVLAGHCHQPEVKEIGANRFYANSGDWVFHRSYLSLPPGHRPPELHFWPED